jgi:hypothetical protein
MCFIETNAPFTAWRIFGATRHHSSGKRLRPIEVRALARRERRFYLSRRCAIAGSTTSAMPWAMGMALAAAMPAGVMAAAVSTPVIPPREMRQLAREV